MGKPPLFFVIIVAIIILFATHHFLQKRKQDQINANSPIHTIQVTVIDKKAYPYPDRRTRQRQVVPVEDMRYQVDFRDISSGKTMTFYLAKQQYDLIEQGASGTLQLQGTQFIRYTVKQ